MFFVFFFAFFRLNLSKDRILRSACRAPRYMDDHFDELENVRVVRNNFQCRYASVRLYSYLSGKKNLKNNTKAENIYQLE